MLQHNTSTVIVFQSVQYNNFIMINGNRPLNETKIRRIIKEIESGNDMLQYYPIQVRVVGDKLEIFDGQHRYFICKKLKRPVHYILIQEKKSMSDIANINSNVEKWKGVDFINCYLQAGNKNYQTIQKFSEDYGFSLGVVLTLLDRGEPGKDNGALEKLTQQFQKGLYVIRAYDEAVAFAEMCKRFSSFKNWRARGLLIALYRIRKAGKVSIDELVNAYHKNPDMLTEQANYKDYVLCLEKIMNHGKSKRIIIT